MTKEEFENFCKRNSNYLVCYHEAIGRFEMINNALASITGFTREELLGKNPYDFIHPDDKDHFQNNAHLPALEGKVPDAAVEYRFLRKDGSYAWLRTEITPVKNEYDQVSDLITETHDISELVALQSDNEKAVRLFDDTCRIAQIGAWVLDLESMTTTWSKMVYDIHELEHDFEPDLDTMFDFFPGEARQKLADAVSTVIDKGVPFDIVLPFVTAKGKHIWIRALAKAKIQHGKTISLYGVFQNVKRQTDERNVLHERLRELEEENAQLGNIVMSMQLIS